MQSFQHIVIGTGSMGAAACYYLASRGQKVLGIDRFDPPHELGAHGGQSRIIRKAYFEHPDYIPLLQRAYEGWMQLEKRSGQKIYHETGLLYSGPQGHPLMESVKESARRYDIPLYKRPAGEFPLFSFPGDYELWFEPEAGFLLPDIAIRTFISEAKKSGAEMHTGEIFLNWEKKDGRIIVNTDKESYITDKIIFTAGPHTAKLLPRFADNLSITRQVLAWMKPDNEEPYQPDNFPCWLVASNDTPGAYYGFPALSSQLSGGPSGIKIALHYPGEPTDPDRVNRATGEEDTRNIIEFVKKHFTDTAGKITDVKTCLYSMTPDEHFVIDLLPGSEARACMAWGFSGHGFKFASAVGEALADLSMHGKTELPIGFLSAGRFSGQK